LKISITIPCRNEVPFIEECIEAIFASEFDFAADMVVYVVDGMSDDGTREKIRYLQEKFKDLHLIDNQKQLTPFAFNLGIKQDSTADFYQIVGARHILSPNYLSTCVKKLKDDTSIWCIGGKIINEYINETGEYISKAMSTTFGMGIGNFRTLNESGFTDTVTSPMYPRFVFERIGFFDEELVRNQDDDFNFRVSKAGGKIWFESSISLKYYVRGNLKQLWKQFMQYGYWKVYVNKKHNAVTTYRQLVPPLFILYLFFVLISLFFPFFIKLAIAAPLFLYLLLNLITTLKGAKNLGAFFNLIIIYPILHVSYGMGYLKGIIRFLLLNKKPSTGSKTLSR
jgi:GT2 family glycosyltransferase